MKKSEIRNKYKEKRLLLSAAEVSKMDDLMLVNFQKLEIDIPALIMTYSPVKKLNEFDPLLVTDYCYFKNPGQQLFYPVMVEHNEIPEMSAVIVDDNTFFKPSKYGMDEPVDGIDMFASEIDMVIVPLLCFDKRGNWVGYGTGYYDRFLKLCRKDCLKIGFSYFDPIEKITDVNRRDVKLDYCLTPETTFAF